jgi:AcrR family transcriptional regulator
MDSNMAVIPERHFQARGLARRQHLIDTAREMLWSEDFEQVTFSAIASRAGVPEGSAYHFFPNRLAIFQEVGRLSGKEFEKAIWDCKPRRPAMDWGSLLEAQINSCLDIYDNNPVYRKLLLTMSIQPETYSIEHDGNRILAQSWAENLRSHYRISDNVPLAEKLSLMTECVDALLRLSLLEEGAITKQCRLDCQHMGKAFIGVFVPAYVEPRFPADNLQMKDSAETNDVQ